MENEKLETSPEQVQRLRKTVADYFGEDFLKRTLNGDIDMSESGRNVDCSILFFDLRESTRIAEEIPPDTFSDFLNEIFTDVMDLIYGNGGFVNKLMGDGILATFGVPVRNGNDALNAARCALQIHNHLNTYNDVLPDYLNRPVKAGIGLARGVCFVGTVGSIRHREFAILGNPVNIAARLQTLTKKGPYPILIDEQSYRAIENNVVARRVHYSRLKGKQERIGIYSLSSLK